MCDQLVDDINIDKISVQQLYIELIKNKDEALIKKINLHKGNKVVYSEHVRKYRQKYYQCVKCCKNDKTEVHVLYLLKTKKEYN